MSDPKTAVFEQFARLGKILSSSSRLVLLDLLAQGEKPVEVLAEQANLTISNTSNHLRELRATSLVLTRRRGKSILYRLAGPSVRRLVRALQDVAHDRLAEVRELVRSYYEDPDALEAVDAHTLRSRIEKGDVVVLDVRPSDEYRSGHVSGAISIPIDELDQRLSEIPRDRQIVAYCRGPYCLYSRQAVERLREEGLEALRMEEGIPEWAAEGLPVTVGG